MTAASIQTIKNGQTGTMFRKIPNARGRSILCVCLGDGEQTRWNRNEFVGILKDEFLPDWARENLKQYQTPENTQGMEMTL